MADRQDGWSGKTVDGVEVWSLEDILTEYGVGLERSLTEDRTKDRSGDRIPPKDREADGAPDVPAAVLREEARQAAPDAAGDEADVKIWPGPGRRGDGRGRAAPRDGGPSPKRETNGGAGTESASKSSKRPRALSMEDLVGRTVDAVMAERRERTLFSRRMLEKGRIPAEMPEVMGPEVRLEDAAAEARARYDRLRPAPAAFVTALLPLLVLILERLGVPLPGGTVRTAGTALCLGATAFLCRDAWTASPGGLLCGISALAAALDCLAALVLAPWRSPAGPYGAAACIGLLIAQTGACLESRGMFDTFRAASVDPEPPWLVTDTGQGACKQRGAVPGFYTFAMARDPSTAWQGLALPLILTGSAAFAALSSFGQGRPGDFFLDWSATLAAGATFSLPLCWSLPWARLARRLQKAGCAAAGWHGAERISRKRTMILTDGDLFPPGAVELNGIRLSEGVEMGRALSLAASVTRAASCGLERLFADPMRSELGAYLPVEDLSFYEEGGWSARIEGRRVLLGTASFLRRMDVALPRDVDLGTGMFLAEGRRLTAVFALRYEATENVDFALKLLRGARITPILAVRDPNITPALLRRKFRREIRAGHPPLADRVALSEAEFDRDLPRALLFREGLLPYAEAVVGSRRLCRGVRRATVLGLVSSAAGMLLAFYMVFQARYDLLTPLSLVVFLILWAIPALLLMDLA